MASSEKDNGLFGGEEEGEADAIVKSCFLSDFSEGSETTSLISSLPEVLEDQRTTETTIQKFLGSAVQVKHFKFIRFVALMCTQFVTTCFSCALSVIMNKYQEQPHLLDPHLGTLHVQY